MKLFLVEHSGWGSQYDIVRAESIEAVRKITGVSSKSATIITEIPVEGPEGVVWTYENSPDTPRED